MDRHALIRSRVLGLLLVIDSLLYLMLPVFAVRWSRLPFSGIFFDPNLVVNQTTEAIGEPPLGYPERLLAIDSAPVRTVGDVQRVLGGHSVGERVEMVFTQPTEGSIVSPTRLEPPRTIMVELRPFSPAELFNWFWRFYLVGLVTLVVGLWTFRARPDTLAAQAFALFTVIAAWGTGGLFDALTTQRLIRLWVFSLCFAGSLHLFLVFVFPYEVRFLRRWPWLKGLILLAAAALTVWAEWWLFSIEDAWAYAIPWRNAYTLNGLALTGSLGLLGYRSLRSASPLVRQQSRLILLSALLAFGPVTIWFLSQLQAFPLQVALLPIVIYPLAIGYIIIRYRLLNIDVVLRRTLTYALLFAAYAAAVALFSLAFGPYFAADNTTLLVLFVLVVTVTFDALRSRTQGLVDAYFFRRPVAYDELLNGYNQALTKAVTVDQIAQALLEYARRGVPQAGIQLYLPDAQVTGYSSYPNNGNRPVAPDSPLVKVMRREPGAIFLGDERTWPVELQAHREEIQRLDLTAIVPMSSDEKLLGWLALSLRGSGRRLEQVELNYLNGLANQSLIALERMSLMRRLETRVEELNLLAQFSQALNFTVQFDDLLELIFTNCQRVLRVRDFSIALCDPETDALYTAFRVEGDERRWQREGKAWLVQDGEVLHVARTGQPAHFQREGEDWLAAPLNAGAVTLGVLVAWAPAGSFNQRQEQLFGLLADRAATALDRWQADEKLQRRAEQLQTLSQVTQSLVATVALDSLLEMILNKAIELLEAEAGSILMVDEDTGELEFHVVSGPVGQELVGTRLPFNTGLAGTVAQTARPVLVNDVQHDRRWFGDVDAHTEFVTRSSLSVPLLQHRQVLGVLQIINRRNGAPFNLDDQELLMAFAGQAVVALATARLLKQTDAVLQARVSELSLLQQMDRDLGTTLELGPVVEKALDWSLRICEGTAGAIALADEEGMLHLRAVRGYDASFDPAAIEPQTLHNSVLGQVWQEGELRVVGKVHEEPAYMSGAFTTQAQLVLPIKYKQEQLGAIAIEREQEGAFGEDDLDMAARVVTHASSAIANALLYEQIVEANNAKSEFVSMVSHELRTPMTAIRGFTELMLAETMGTITGRQREFLETINRNIVRMGRLIQDLTDISRIETGKLEVNPAPVPFSPIVSEAVQTTQGMFAEKEICLHVDLPAGLPLVLADQQRLVQVLTNLLSNAGKYSPPGAEVFVSVGAEAGSNGYSERPVVVCSVRDTGYGISPADQERLFTKFFRAEDDNIRQSPGTGLGLSITKGIIELHGGTIWCESEPGAGTTFTFTVPQAG